MHQIMLASVCVSGPVFYGRAVSEPKRMHYTRYYWKLYSLVLIQLNQWLDFPATSTIIILFTKYYTRNSVPVQDVFNIDAQHRISTNQTHHCAFVVGVNVFAFLRRAMKSSTRITGQLRQPTTSLNTWPITWDIKWCLCLFNHHSPKHTPDW